MSDSNGNTTKLSSRGIPGVEMRLGIGTYVLAPVALSKLRTLQADFDRLYKFKDASEGAVPEFEVQGFERSEIMAKFVEASLKRNYDTVIGPTGTAVALDENSVLEILDLGNRDAAFNAVLGITGLSPVGEAAAGSEPDRPTSSVSGTGSPSLTEPSSQTE